jgi:hypothetical protein
MISSLRPAWAIQQNPVSKTTTENKTIDSQACSEFVLGDHCFNSEFLTHLGMV